MRPKANAQETAQMYADYQAGMSCYTIGRKYHYNPTTVWNRFKTAGLKLRPSNKAKSEYVGEGL